MPIFYERRQLVTPGDLLAEDDYIAGENTYKENGEIYATRVGLVNYENRNIYVMALKSFYFPMVGDTVIGKVIDIRGLPFSHQTTESRLCGLIEADLVLSTSKLATEPCRLYVVRTFLPFYTHRVSLDGEGAAHYRLHSSPRSKITVWPPNEAPKPHFFVLERYILPRKHLIMLTILPFHAECGRYPDQDTQYESNGQHRHHSPFPPPRLARDRLVDDCAQV